MANLVRSRSWGLVRPPLGATIDWGHPLAQGLRFAALYDSSRGLAGPDLVTGYAPSTTPAAYGYPASGRHFPGVRFDGATTAGWNYGQLAGTNLTGQISIMAIASSTGTHWQDVSNPVLISRDSNTAGRGYTLDVANNGGNASWRFYNSGGGAGTLQATMTPDKLQHVIATDNTTTESNFYVDGFLIHNAGTTGAPSSTTANLRVGRRDYAAFEGYWWGYISMAAIWDRVLSKQEAAWLYAEPYAFLQAPAPRFAFYGFQSPPVVRVIPPTVGTRFPNAVQTSKVLFSPRTGTAPYWWPITVSNLPSDVGPGLNYATRYPNPVPVSKVMWAPRAGTAPYWWPLFISNTPSSSGLDTDATAAGIPRPVSQVLAGITPPPSTAVTPWVPVIEGTAPAQPLTFVQVLFSPPVGTPPPISYFVPRVEGRALPQPPPAAQVLWAPPRGVDPYWWPLAVRAANIAQTLPAVAVLRGSDPRAYDRQTAVYTQAQAIAQALQAAAVRTGLVPPTIQPWAQLLKSTGTLPELAARGRVYQGIQVTIVGPPPDFEPITITIYDRGHAIAIEDLGHTAGILDRGHTLGYDDQGHTASRRGRSLTLREQRNT